MDRVLRPPVLELEPDAPNAPLLWRHWYKRFQNFLRSMETTEEEKFRILINYISSDIFEHVSLSQTYNEAVAILRDVFEKPPNEIVARHLLSSRSQHPNESVDRYLASLKLMSRDCQFRAVTAETYRDESVRDSFIRGLLNKTIRQRLLENGTLTLDEAHRQARALELATVHAQAYDEPGPTISAVSPPTPKLDDPDRISVGAPYVNALQINRCYFCGKSKHPRSSCPALKDNCHTCNKVGHWKSVCRSGKTGRSSSKPPHSAVITLPISSAGVSIVKTTVLVDGHPVCGMIDSGSDISIINEATAKNVGLAIHKTFNKVGLASNSHHADIIGKCKADINMLGHSYPAAELSVMHDLCFDLIVGRNLLLQHSSVLFDFGGEKAPLRVCVAVAEVAPAQLFTNLTSDCHPIAVKSRVHSKEDAKFIKDEIRKLFDEGIIEDSISPWRAQVLVAGGGNHKRRMCIDYSRTINRFTQLDAYPLPKISDIVNEVAGYSIFSTIDLRSAYHQVPIPKQDRPYTAFEACGKLFQFTRIPFGVTNGVAGFQRVVDGIIKKEGLKDTFAYLDDLTICGRNQQEHDLNLERFMKAATKYNLTINNGKSSFSQRSINILGHSISNHTIRPDPNRLKPLTEYPPPTDQPSLKRALGMFSHYSKFIPNFSKRIRPLVTTSFPLSDDALAAFSDLKMAVADSSLAHIDIENEIPFCIETDASDATIAATLTQSERPVAFFSRTLSDSERRHSSIEKEAYAIVEAIRYWRHFLLGRHFTLITDQRSVSFMFDMKHSGKIKNEKIVRWRMELSCYSYDIVYRPGTQNHAADALSRACLISNDLSHLCSLHRSLSHPGVTRMNHWIRSKNLPYSLDEIRRVISSCKICSEVKPRFFKHNGTLIKATAPFERLNMDFKGPLPTNSSHGNRYLLTIIDEYSRFPFAFACQDITSDTVKRCLGQLFSIFGAPAYVHTDRGSSFMSQDLRAFLAGYGTATSRTTPYNPQGNGQIERLNGTLWKTIELAIKENGLSIRLWETVLQDALHAIRSLLCTSINCTPHERMFNHPRRSSNGKSTPTWLLNPGQVLLRNFDRRSKFDPIVQEVTLLDGGHDYARIRYPNGRETTVSSRHLAPLGAEEYSIPDDPSVEGESTDAQREGLEPPTHTLSTPQSHLSTSTNLSPRTSERFPPAESPPLSPRTSKRFPHPAPPSLTEQDEHVDEAPLRRSTRPRKPPAHLADFVRF